MKLKEGKEKLDKISSSFCIAKWKQVTIHLENGLTHSCHHPRVHKIPLDELKNNPGALHNTKYKINLRKQMLNNEFIPECEYCNIVECNKNNEKQGIYSDRIFKSTDSWAWKYKDECITEVENVYPSYLEVSFSSVCNCTCLYCSPQFSNAWKKEIEKFGAYKTKDNSKSLKDYSFENTSKDTNPYIKAFWEWWPDVYPHLHTFRITGGEPLLSNETFKVMDYISKNPKQNFKFNINSNLSISDELFEKFIQELKTIKSEVIIFTSNEAYDKKSEYIRVGMNYNKWLKRIKRILKEIPNSKVSIMAAYNVLSISSFQEFLEDIWKLKNTKINDKYISKRILIDVPYITNPRYLSVNIIDNSFIKYIKENLDFMKSKFIEYSIPGTSKYTPGFEDFEIRGMERLIPFISEAKNKDSERKDFKIFIDEHDKRYGTTFLEIFPEYREFYEMCGKI